MYQSKINQATIWIAPKFLFLKSFYFISTVPQSHVAHYTHRRCLSVTSIQDVINCLATFEAATSSKDG